MRSYGSVQVRFWEYAGRHRLSDKAVLLAIYLLTGPHSNMLGCIRLPDGYIKEDLRWDEQSVKDAFHELVAIKFLHRDEFSSWLVIVDFLKWNPIKNPKQGVGIQKLFENIPDDSVVYKPLVNNLLTYNKYLDKQFLNRLHKMVYSDDADQDQYKDQVKEQHQDRIQEKNQDTDIQDSPESLSTNNFLLQISPNEPIAKEVLEFLNLKANKSFDMSYGNLHWIIARLTDGSDADTCRQIIVRKCRLWLGDPKMDVYLRPSTLFSEENFLKYKGELVLPEENECVVAE